MPLSKYKAVFFDVGGTLLKVHPSVGEVYAREAVEYGFRGSGEVLDKEFRRQWKEMGGIESLDGQSGFEVEKQFWRDLVFKVFEPQGGLESFDDYFEQVYDLFTKKESWRIFDDVADSKIFEKLRERGVVLGIISNWDSRLPKTLESLGLKDHFDFILASTVVGSAKPNRKIFDEALRLSAVSAHEACHIGDEISTDIAGAQDSGIDAIWIDRRNRREQTKVPTIRSFMELV